MAQRSRIDVLAFCALTAAVIVYVMTAVMTLPTELATHFDLGGRPNDWMSRATFQFVMLAMIAWTWVLFLALRLAIPKLDDRWISLPHRDYWLAPERRDRSLAALGGMAMGIGALTQLFFAALFALVAQANEVWPPRLSPWTPWIIGGYVAVVGLMCGAIVLRFRNPEP